MNVTSRTVVWSKIKKKGDLDFLFIKLQSDLCHIQFIDVEVVKDRSFVKHPRFKWSWITNHNEGNSDSRKHYTVPLSYEPHVVQRI